MSRRLTSLHQDAVCAIPAAIWLWKPGRDEPIRFDARGGPLYALAFIKGGEQLATGTEDGTVRIWDRSGHLVAALPGSDGRVPTVAAGPGRPHVLSGDRDGNVRVWRPPNVTVLDGGDAIFSVDLSADGERLAATTGDGRVWVWPADGPASRGVSVRAAQPDSLGDVAVDGTGRRVAIAGNQAISVWDATRDERPSILEADVGDPWSIAFAPGERQLLTGTGDGDVTLVDLDGSRSPTVLSSHEGPITALVVDPKRSSVLSTSERTVHITSLRPPHATRVVSLPHALWRADLSADGRTLLTAGLDGRIRLATLRGRSRTALAGHDGAVWDARFALGGRRIVSAGEDGTVRVWDLASSAALVLTGHRGPVNSVDTTPDGRRIVSGGDDGTVGVWSCDVCVSDRELVRLGEDRWVP